MCGTLESHIEGSEGDLMHPTFFAGTGYEINSWYLLLLVGAVVAAVSSTLRRPKDFPVSFSGYLFLVLLMVYFGTLFSKLLSMVLHHKDFIHTTEIIVYPGIKSSVISGNTFPEEIKISGNAFMGGLSGIIAAVFLFAKLRIRRISFLKLADHIVPYVFLMQAFTRIGCFLYGCCYGKATQLPWGCIFPNAGTSPVHPVQLYLCIADLINFFTMRYLYKKGQKPGVVFFASLTFFGFVRFFIEFLRVDSTRLFSVFTIANLSTFCFFIIGILGVHYSKKRSVL
ncbi:MAG: prolipoprotein diacylglyceryl transferase [Candidatus Omnitrophica bacterium]|nr:prolipoprotein diacylglyceryl transferase [Candidatus Omnitrophota bacterium]